MGHVKEMIFEPSSSYEILLLIKFSLPFEK